MADLLEGINPLALVFPEAEESTPAEDPRDAVDYCEYLETAIENEKRLIGSLAGQEGKEGELAKHAARLKALKARLAEAEKKVLAGDEWPDVGGLRERGDLVSYDLDTCAECEEPLDESKGDVKAKLKAWLSKASSDEPIAESKKEKFPGFERLKKHLKKASKTEPIAEGKKVAKAKLNLKKASKTEPIAEGKGGLVDKKGAPREDLPKCVREYIAKHPNATVKELADWYDAHCGEEA